MLGNSHIFEIDRSGRSQYGLSANVERSANPAALAAPPARAAGGGHTYGYTDGSKDLIDQDPDLQPITSSCYFSWNAGGPL